MFILLELRKKGSKNYFTYDTYKISSDDDMRRFTSNIRNITPDYDVRISYIK